MKYITVAIPSYNSQDYLYKAIESALFSEEIEIIVINDGSKDDTLKIANEYKKRYPNIVKVIDKENGGHGSGVNEGLKHATGLYYKVLDSDDWLDENNGLKILGIIKEHYQNNISPDLYITDFKYNKTTDNTSFVRSYSENFPSKTIFGWEDLNKPFKYSKTLLMHALMFKTETLRNSGVLLPNHTFYVDNIFSYKPLFFTKTMYYIPVVFYNYYIGRDDQSVNMKNIIKNYQQQIKVMDILLNEYNYQEIMLLERKQRKYLKHFLAAIMMITQMFTTGEYSKERKRALKKLWQDLKLNDKKMYNFLRYRSFNFLVNFLPWKLKGFVMKKGYLSLVKKIKLG